MPIRDQSFRPFLAVYAVTLAAMAFDFTLIAAMPQGIRLTPDILISIATGIALTLAGLILLRMGQRSLTAGALAYANVSLLSQINLLAHLGPSYIGRSYGFIDETLARIDAKLGFDWIQYFEWQVQHPWFGMACRVAYLCWPYYALLMVVILAAYRQVPTLARFVIASTVSLSIVYLIAIFTPSYGAYVQYKMTAMMHPGFMVQFSDYKATYDALRAGNVDIYAAEIPSGAISFPSFHTTTVMLYIWAAWNTPARWATVLVQALCFLTIPVQGAHFLTDMIAGGAIGIVSIMLTKLIVPEGQSGRLGLGSWQKQRGVASAPSAG